MFQCYWLTAQQKLAGHCLYEMVPNCCEIALHTPFCSPLLISKSLSDQKPLRGRSPGVGVPYFWAACYLAEFQHFNTDSGVCGYDIIIVCVSGWSIFFDQAADQGT